MTITKTDKKKFKRTKEQETPLNPKVKKPNKNKDLGFGKTNIKETQEKH
ncbi:hypothetical protein [Aegicerativicinus sediminis]|nr:hypothetical protein [Aegicerativicinus sediminis]